MTSKSVGMFQRPVEYRTRGKVLRMPQLEYGNGVSYNYTKAFSNSWNQQVNCIDCGEYEDAATNKTVCDYYSYYEIYPAPSSIPTSEWQMQVLSDSKISEGWVLDKHINYCTQSGTYERSQKNVRINDYVYSSMVKDFFVGFVEYKERVVLDEQFIYIIGIYLGSITVESANSRGTQYYNSIYEAFYLEVFNYAKNILAEIYQKEVITKSELIALQA